jgi:hypothetical protein
MSATGPLPAMMLLPTTNPSIAPARPLPRFLGRHWNVLSQLATGATANAKGLANGVYAFVWNGMKVRAARRSAPGHPTVHSSEDRDAVNLELMAYNGADPVQGDRDQSQDTLSGRRAIGDTVPPGRWGALRR